MEQGRKRTQPTAHDIEGLLHEVIEEFGSPTPLRFRSGFEVLDISRVLQPGRLITLAAASGSGKTSFCTKLATCLARSGAEVTFLSLEMSAKEMVKRMFCIDNGFDQLMAEKKGLTDFQKGISKHYLEEIQPTLDHIDIIDDFGLTDEEMFRLVDEIYTKPMDFVIIDHIQHILSTANKSEREQINDYLLVMKECARKHNVCFIILSQLNDDGVLKSSRKINEISDAVVYLELDKEKVCENNGFANLAKNRYGPTDKFPMYFDLPTMNWVNSYREYEIHNSGRRRLLESQIQKPQQTLI